MADQKISALTAYITPKSGDLLSIVDTSNATTKEVDILNLGIVDGWIPATGSCTYASASTITVPSGAASLYQKGDRIKWTQTTVKYGVIVTVADTLLTIAVNTDYVVTNAAITLNYYSHSASPIGYPGWFAWTPTWTGFSANPAITAKFSIIGNTICIVIDNVTGNGTSNTTTLTITNAPVPALRTIQLLGYIGATDNGANVAQPGHAETTATSATISFWKSFYQGAWTGSGSKAIRCQLSYEF
jgi:hypothetical protein